MADGEKFRVLIVDDIAETRENIRKLLQFEADIEVVAVARTGREAIQLTQEVNPDVVLMDINMPDMDGIAATEIIRQKMPAVQVVVLSVQGDQNYMRKAMLVGARDFLTKPPMPDELVAAIRRAGKMAREERSKNAQAYVACTEWCKLQCCIRGEARRERLSCFIAQRVERVAPLWRLTWQWRFVMKRHGLLLWTRISSSVM